jgi:hypothetical protein
LDQTLISGSTSVSLATSTPFRVDVEVANETLVEPLMRV